MMTEIVTQDSSASVHWLGLRMGIVTSSATHSTATWMAVTATVTVDKTSLIYQLTAAGAVDLKARA
jgi:hypothetical protein